MSLYSSLNLFALMFSEFFVYMWNVKGWIPMTDDAKMMTMAHMDQCASLRWAINSELAKGSFVNKCHSLWCHWHTRLDSTILIKHLFQSYCFWGQN
jgi:hypothetical protein